MKHTLVKIIQTSVVELEGMINFGFITSFREEHVMVHNNKIPIQMPIYCSYYFTTLN